MLLLPEMYVWIEWERRRRWLSCAWAHTHIHRGISVRFFLSETFLSCIFAWLVQVISRPQIFSVSPHVSTFASLVKGHLKACNHLSFFSLLYSRKPSARPESRATWHLAALRSVFVQLESKSALVYRVFRTPMQILVVTPSTYTLHVYLPPSDMSRTQFTWYFCSWTTCIPFTLGNRTTYCYATHATCAAFSAGK